MIIGVLLCIVGLALNKWTVEFVFAKYVGNGLSIPNSVLIYLFNLYCLLAGILIIKGIKLPIKEAVGMCALFIPFIVPRLYYYQILGDYDLCIKMVYGALLTYFPYLLIILIIPRFGFAFCFLLQSVICVSLCVFIYIYQTLPGEETYFIVYETNFREALGYFSDYISLINIFIFVICIIFCYIFSLFSYRLNGKNIRYAVLLILPFLLTAFYTHLASPFSIYRHNLEYRLQVSYESYRRFQAESLQKISLTESQLESITHTSSKPQKEVHVLILGESCDRDYMSVYGYRHKTNPLLEEMKDELYLFDNVISSFTHTIANLKVMLSFENYENKDRSSTSGNVINYLKKSGYHTYWISNQGVIGNSNLFSALTAKGCDESAFLRMEHGFDPFIYDEVILPKLNEALKDDVDKKYIFIHLMGQHNQFYMRYPKAYEKFNLKISGKTEKQQKSINQYLNATLYNDYVVAEILNTIKNEDLYSTVLYVSDHGLEIYDVRDFVGHNYINGLEVPFIAWVSDIYKNEHANQVMQFSDFLMRPYMTDDIIHSIFDLLHIQFDSVSTQRSIFSPNFLPRTRVVHSISMESYLYDDFKKE